MEIFIFTCLIMTVERSKRRFLIPIVILLLIIISITSSSTIIIVITIIIIIIFKTKDRRHFTEIPNANQKTCATWLNTNN